MAMLQRTQTMQAASLQGFLRAGTMVMTLLTAGTAWSQSLRLHIPTQPAATGIAEFARQTGVQVLVLDRHARGKTTHSVMGDYTVAAGLTTLLEGTGLEARSAGANTWTIVPAQSEMRSPQPASAPAQTSGEVVTDIPEVLVLGPSYWSLNTGIPRSEDDSQPYLVFEQEQLERSGARTLEGFFRAYLGPNTAVSTSDENIDQSGLGRINLRGLGSTETLILLDGRRLAGANTGAGYIEQANVAGIPLESIERIEVLASSAASIYGANATGGVINIIRKRDYRGLQATVGYGNVVNGSAPSRKVGLSGGWLLNDERTHVSFNAAWRESAPLLQSQRDYLQRYRAFAQQNNPAYFAQLTSPPMGATTNILSADGRPLTFDDGTPLGSHFTHSPDGYRGAAIDGISGLRANAGTYNTENGQTSVSGALTRLTQETRSRFASVAARHEVVPDWTVYAEASLGDDRWRSATNSLPFSYVLPGNAPNNPFRQAIRVTVPHVGADVPSETAFRTWRGIAGTIIDLPGDWQSVLDLTWSRSRYSTALPVPPVDAATMQGIRSGTTDVLRDLRVSPIAYGHMDSVDAEYTDGPADATNRSTSLRAAGPLPLDVGGGPAVATFMVERSKDALDELRTVINTSSSSSVSFTPSRWLTTNSVYLEVKAPVFGPANAGAWRRELELQVAARYDDYSGEGAQASMTCRSQYLTPLPQDVIDQPCPSPGTEVPRARVQASSTNPTYSMRWRPIDGMTLRSSYATGFLPTYLHQTVRTATPIVLVDVTDPLRDNEPVGAPLVPGSQLRALLGDGIYIRGNPDLKPERSTSYSAGVILEPTWAPGLRLAADWTRIDKHDNFYDPLVLLSGDNDGLAPGGQAMFEAIFIKKYPERVVRGAPSGGFAVGPITAIDASMVDLLGARTGSWDYAAGYDRDFPAGRMELSFRGTYLKELSVEYAPGQPAKEMQGVVEDYFARGMLASGGVRKKAYFSALWTTPRWQLGWGIRYIDKYYLDVDRTVVLNLGSAVVKSQTYHDLFGRWHFTPRTDVRFALDNVFDRPPPFDYVGVGISRFADPRQSHYSVTVSHEF